MVSIINDDNFEIKANYWTDDEDDTRGRFSKGNDYFIKYILHP